MTYSKILKEDLYLNLTPSDLLIETKGLVDTYLEPYILLRDYGKKTTIHYLYATDTLIIPNEYFRLFSGTNLREGDKYSDMRGRDVEGDTEVDQFIRYFIHLVSLLEAKRTGPMCQDLIGKLLIIGTKEFRGWIEEELGITLPGWKTENLNGEIEI